MLQQSYFLGIFVCPMRCMDRIQIYLCVSVCVSVTLSVNSPTGQTPQRIFTVDRQTRIYARMCLLGVLMMNNHRQLWSATETSWVVSYDGKTIPRWRRAAILKIDISPYLSEKSSDFDEILYTAADFELDKRHVIENEKVALDRRISCF